MNPFLKTITYGNEKISHWQNYNIFIIGGNANIYRLIITRVNKKVM